MSSSILHENGCRGSTATLQIMLMQYILTKCRWLSLYFNLQVRVPGTHGMIFNMFECILKFKNTKNIPNDERWTT